MLLMKIIIPAGRFPYILLGPLFTRKWLLWFSGGVLFISFPVHAQREEGGERDTVLPVYLEEVIVISDRTQSGDPGQAKPLSSLDEYLTSARKVNMVKRGAYAWEPTLNSMSSERLSVTIDGMRIFGACTDKMDPITSYVDVSNLSEAHIASGQQGAEYGVSIGGAIDLKIDKAGFKEDIFIISLENGFETNNEQKIIGADINFSKDQYYIDGDIVYRKAGNYSAGGGEEVHFSQYEKYNISLNGGYQLGPGKKLAATLVYDEANDVGYPALPMDVSLARAVITSLSYEQDTLGVLHHWESKLYYNTITHVMDDSQRPDVLVRMDMPGWSDAYGFYSRAALKTGKHRLLFKWDGFYNKSLAEMTMYPANRGEASMFMLTWPDVRTLNTGLYLEDIINFKESSLKVSARVTVQGNRVADKFGLNSLRIFYPDAAASQTRFLSSIATQYSKQLRSFQLNFGLAYATRAPSVSEGYGFYLFNSFDNHDYVGNPGLENERSMELNAGISMTQPGFKLSFEGNAFRIHNYIIGKTDSSLSTMTIGADGVRIYTNLRYADIVNLSFNSEYKIAPGLTWSGAISWHRGTDNQNRDLPFISPWTYQSFLKYDTRSFYGEVSAGGAGKQVNFNRGFGEDETPAYTIFSMALGKTFYIYGNRLYTKAGIENIFDRYYSAYSDWNNIPRMGRNLFFNISYKIN